MSICINMDIGILAKLSSDELRRHRWNGSNDEGYCIELLRCALVEHSDEAWLLLQHCFRETLRTWIWKHPGRDVALLRDSEENYIAQTFTRFWLAVHDQHVEFMTLSAMLGYLHATLNGLLTDTLRSHLRRQSKESSLSAPGNAHEFEAPNQLDDHNTWECIESLIPDERERRLAYLLYHCGLKPREIMLRCPQEFADVKEIYRINANLIVRLRRNRERLRYLLYGGEE